LIPVKHMPEVGAQGAQLLDLLRALARELHPRDPAIERHGLDDSLERDFGLDSLARVELAARIERTLGVRLPEAGFSEAETARDLLRFFDAAPPAIEPAAAALAVPREGPATEHPALAVETLTEALDWHLARHPERAHITLYGERDGVEEIGFGALAREAGAFAAGLAARGVAPGERVAIMLPTGRGFFVAFYGALRAGAIPVPLYPPARPAQLEQHFRRIAGIVANSGARLFVTVEPAKLFAHVLQAHAEALRLIERYERPDQPSIPIHPRAARGYACTEAPRGTLYHRYRIDESGAIREAKIVPPTSQNQKTIEQDLWHFVPQHFEDKQDELRWRCEQAIRNYDPCISCSTHFLKLDIERD